MRKVFMISVITIAVLFLGYTIYFAYEKFQLLKPYTGELVGIRGTGVYHKSDCMFVKKAPSQTLVLFPDINAAANELYRPCKTCMPPDNTALLDKSIQEKSDQEQEKSEKSDTEKEQQKISEDALKEAKQRFMNGEFNGGFSSRYYIEKLIKEGLLSKSEYNDTLAKYHDIYSSFLPYEDYLD